MRPGAFYRYIFFCLLLTCIVPPARGQADVTLETAIVKRDALQPDRVLLLPGSFDSIKALKALFPGKYYDLTKGSGYANRLVSWKCPDCAASKYPDVNEVEDEPSFPFREGVATRLINVINLKDASGGRYKILAFNHSVFDEDGLQTGRFSGGLLGLAKFAQTDSGWLMRSFQPAISAYGAFASCPKPEALLIGDDQYAFLVRHVNGGGGGPFDGSFFVIAGANGKYSQVMAAYRTGRSNTEEGQSNWASELTVPASRKKYFRDIVVTTSGTYVPHKYEEPLPVLAEQVKGIRSCKFRFTTTYVYTAAKGYELQAVSAVTLTDVRR